MATTTVEIPIDLDLIIQADELFEELGIDFPTAVILVIRQAVRLGKIPFEPAVDRPNQETIEALLEAQRIINDPTVKKYDDVEEFLMDLRAEIDESE